MPPGAVDQPLRFGRFEISPAERLLRVDGQPVALGARAFDLLLALVERRSWRCVWARMPAHERPSLRELTDGSVRLSRTVSIAAVDAVGSRLSKITPFRLDLPIAASPRFSRSSRPSGSAAELAACVGVVPGEGAAFELAFACSVQGWQADEAAPTPQRGGRR